MALFGVSRINKLLGNSIFVFVLTISLFAASYYLAIEKMELSYSVSAVETISKEGGAPGLKFTWNDAPINKSIKRVKIVVWNSGSLYIDRENISDTYPLKLSFGKVEGFELLGGNVSAVSRDNLDVSFVDNYNASGGFVFGIKGDDGLEKGDGFVVSVFFTGDTPDLSLSGRVKGIAGEFKRQAWSNIYKNQLYSDKKVYLILCFSIMIAVLLLLSLFRPYENIYLDSGLVGCNAGVAAFLIAFSLVLAFFLAKINLYAVGWVQ